MEFKNMIDISIDIKSTYDHLNIKRGEKKWDVNSFLQGFVGDVGNLSKLIMAKSGFRTIENIDEKLKNELSDCLWSIIVMSKELNIDLETVFPEKMTELKNKVEEKDGEYSESL